MPRIGLDLEKSRLSETESNAISDALPMRMDNTAIYSFVDPDDISLSVGHVFAHVTARNDGMVDVVLWPATDPTLDAPVPALPATGEGGEEASTSATPGEGEGAAEIAVAESPPPRAPQGLRLTFTPPNGLEIAAHFDAAYLKMKEAKRLHPAEPTFDYEVDLTKTPLPGEIVPFGEVGLHVVETRSTEEDKEHPGLIRWVVRPFDGTGVLHVVQMYAGRGRHLGLQIQKVINGMSKEQRGAAILDLSAAFKLDKNTGKPRRALMDLPLPPPEPSVVAGGPDVREVVDATGVDTTPAGEDRQLPAKE